MAARAVPAFDLHFIYCGMQFAVVANELNMRIAIIPTENEKSDPFSKTTEESYTLSICQFQDPTVAPCAVIFSVTDAVAKSSSGSDASNFVQIIFAVLAIPESGSEKTTSLTV